MKYGVLFAALAVLLGWKAWSADEFPDRLLFGYVGLSPAILAVAYAIGLPGLLGKNCKSGKLSAWSWLLLAPYHLLNVALLPTVRRFGLVCGPDEVAPGLWLGPRLLPKDLAALPSFTAVIDMCAELAEDPTLRQTSGYRCFAILDATPPGIEQLRAAIDFAMDGLKRGPIYIHCASGHSRSALVAAGVLMRQGEASAIDAAVAQLRSKRPGVGPTSAQREVLRRLMAQA